MPIIQMPTFSTWRATWLSSIAMVEYGSRALKNRIKRAKPNETAGQAYSGLAALKQRFLSWCPVRWVNQHHGDQSYQRDEKNDEQKTVQFLRAKFIAMFSFFDLTGPVSDRAEAF